MPEANHQIYLSEPTEAAIIVHAFIAKLSVTTYPYPECRNALNITQTGFTKVIEMHPGTCFKQDKNYCIGLNL